MEKVVLGILRRQKRTVVMTSDTPTLASLAQHVLVLEGGRVKVQGSFEEVKHVFPESQEKQVGSNPEENPTPTKSRGAKQRWAKLKIITRCGMIMKDTIEKKKNYKLPVKESVQDAFVSRLGPMASSRRKILGVSRMDSSSQLGLHHDLILPSDDGVQESLGDVEGLLSNRHKQLLIKFLAKKESSRVVSEEDSDNLVPSNSHLLKKLQSERLKRGEHHGHEVRRGSEAQQLNNNNKVVGGGQHHLSLSPKPSLISMMHSKVLRLTSTASAVSGVSGFSDDFQEDENDDGLIGSVEGSQEGREYGSISYNVYWQYLKAGGLTLLAMFIGLSLSLQTLKVYLDYLLR